MTVDTGHASDSAPTQNQSDKNRSRRLWLLSFSLPVGVAAAGAARGWLPLLVVAAAVAAGSVLGGRVGVVGAGAVAAAAWCTTIGPWSGATRAWVTVVAGAITGLFVWMLGRRSTVAAAGIAATVVLASVLMVQGVPATGSTPTTERLREVDAFARDQVGRAGIAGVAVAVAEGGQVVFERGYGTAGGTPMRPDTPVVIGSTSKSVTALVVLNMADRGDLDLDAPVNRYLPWLDPADPRARDITIRQLLVDTSGIPTFAGWSALAGDGHAEPDDIRALVNSLRLTSEPGERFQYSNANYIILGQIIEAITGHTYGQVVQADVFEPLGMTSSSAAAASSRPNRYWFGISVPSHLPYLQVGLPAGALASSASDLARYAQAQLGHPVDSHTINPDVLELAHTPAVEANGFGVPAGRRYAMGWYVGAVADEPAVFHSGDVFDSSSTIVLLPDKDTAVVVVATASNALTPIAKTLGEGIAATLLDQRPPDLPRSLAATSVTALTVAAIIFAFAVTRARRLITHQPAAEASSIVRLAIVDVAIPAAVLVGLPLVFSVQLDRAETLSPLQFWRLLVRGVPDVTTVLLVALLIRLAAAASVIARRAAPASSRLANRRTD